jgi:Cu(I)/Ag(I) efflux system membrane protein CusA/SilA
MSLGGIIIAVGDMVDSAVVLLENAHKKIEKEPEGGRSRTELVIEAARELGPAIFGSLVIITVAFLPVFVLEAQEGRLFRPLAFTKSFSMAFAALLSITLVPALMVLLVRGKIRPERKNPVNRALLAVYGPVLRFCLRHRWILLGAVGALLGATVYPWTRLGSEFMPPLEEGTVLFMPITVPGLSIEEAKRIVAAQDAALHAIPEVATVFGKAGRAETATDPAPLSMFETVITLKPRAEWRKGMTKERLVAEMDAAVRLPGLQAAWTMPIKARVDMLSTGIRTPIGIKVFGKDLANIAAIGESLERILKDVPGTRSVYAERELGGFFVDFWPDRSALARYGLRVGDVLDVVETAIGGMNIDVTVEGRERYTINVRYPRDLRSSIEKLRAVLVPLPGAAAAAAGAPGPDGMESGDAMGVTGAGGGVAGQIPLGLLGRFEAAMGPPMIKSEGGLLTGWVYVDVAGRDIGGYVDDAKAAVARALVLQPGYTLKWTGQYEFLERIRARMQIVIPVTLGIIFLILYLSFGGLTQALLVMLAVPLAATGSIWLMWALGFNTSIAVWVGMIALLGIATETASVMMVYLDEGYRRWRDEGRLHSVQDLVDMTVESGTRRVRPLVMTVGMNIVGLVPVMVGTGIGSDVAKRIAAPLWGGLISLTLLTLVVVPAIYVIWRGLQLRLGARLPRAR